MSEEKLNSETCAECGRLVIVEDTTPPIQAGPTPIATKPLNLDAQPKCDDCGRILLRPHSHV